MKRRLKALLPKPETLRGNRWLNWMGPLLQHPRVWHFSRKGIALGLALGIFFGLLIPVAQIPFAAAFAVVLRANLPVAVASTLVTNPVTFGPVYYGAYKLGKKVLGQRPPSEAEAQKLLEKSQAKPPEISGFVGHIRYGIQHLRSAGKPLIIGLFIVASISGLAVYFLASGLWILKIRLDRRTRLRERAQRNPSHRP